MNEDINNQLLVASASGDIKTVQECLKNGANLEATDAHNVTPLLYAVYNDQKEIVKILLEAGADLTATDSYNFKGYNAIHWAAKYGKADMLRILLTNPRKQQIHVRNLNNELPIDIAMTDEVRKLLLESMEEEKKPIQQPIQQNIPTIPVVQQNIPVQQPIQQPIQQPTQQLDSMYPPVQQPTVQDVPLQNTQHCTRSDSCKKKRIVKRIFFGVMLLFPIINFLFTPYGYPWFIIPWAAAILIGGIRCIRRRTQVFAERAFKIHKLLYIVINGFFIISNFYFGGFPWAMYPVFIWGILLGIHAIKSKFKESRFNTGFHVHLLIYVMASALIFLTYCFATCHHVDFYVTTPNVGHYKDFRMRPFKAHKGMKIHHGIVQTLRQMHPYNMNANNVPTQSSTTYSRSKYQCNRSFFGLLLMLAPIVLWGIGVLCHYAKWKGKLHITLPFNTQQQFFPQQMPQQMPMQQQMPIQQQQIPVENVNASLMNNDVQVHLAQQQQMYPQA